MPLIIRIGYTTEDPRKLDKRNNFNQNSPQNHSATIKDNCSVMTPDFIVSASLADLARSNYLEVPIWGRFYYIDDLVTMPGGRVSIRCREDVLTSNAEQIGDLYAYLDRTEQESDRAKYLADSSVPTELRRQCITMEFDRTPFRANYSVDRVYVLTVLGGTEHQMPEGGE